MPRPIHILVEEPSMEAYLEELIPRLGLGPHQIEVKDFGGKQKLLRELPKRLKGYASQPQAFRPKILVLVDRDAQDCAALKTQLENASAMQGLSTKSANHAVFEVVNRIVVEELEAWHFGDPASLCAAFPGVPANLLSKKPYRDPDAIKGGTHEALLRVLQKAGHHAGETSLPKIDTARRLGALVSTANNRSASFNHFIAGLRALAAQV